MNKELRPFSGEFIKHKNYTASENLLYNGYDIKFCDSLYKKVSREIKKVLGEKEKYSVKDAVFYFQKKYQAYRVPWEYAFWYEDASFDVLYDASGERSPDSMNPFDYSKTSGEQNITLVVDTVYNKNLRKKYPDIGNLEKELSLINQCDREMHCNPIIVIGFFKENIINSMCLCNNYYLNSDASNPRNNILDIDYEMWYFYKHS